MSANVFAPWAEVVPQQTGLMTAEELEALPEDGWFYELVEGRLVRMSPTRPRHGAVTATTTLALGTYVVPRGLGRLFGAETGFLISQVGQPDTVLAPDVSFIQAERLPPIGSPAWDEGFWRLAPDLVVEVASASQYRPEMSTKARVWLAAGVRLVWIIWPRLHQIDVWRLGAEAPITLGQADQLDGLAVLPGFTLPVASLFT
jgi:Uma2 family endonuclease